MANPLYNEADRNRLITAADAVSEVTRVVMNNEIRALSWDLERLLRVEATREISLGSPDAEEPEEVSILGGL